MKIFFSIVLFASFSFTLLGQQKVIQGRLVDKESAKPVPFPTISLDDGTVYAIGNSNGEFEISLPNNSQVLNFSSLGYIRYALKVEDLVKSEKICVYMKHDILVLPEIVVVPGKLKNSILGYIAYPENTKTMSYGDMEYSAFASFYEIKNRPAKIEEANVYIGKNVVGEYTLRCRITEKGTRNSPGKDILKENIIVKSDIENGWIKFDLSKHNIWVDDKSIFLVIEVLQDSKIGNSNFGEVDISTPGFAYLKSKEHSFVSTSPGVWRIHNNRVISNLKIAYSED
jgi:hypothetical protein